MVSLRGAKAFGAQRSYHEDAPGLIDIGQSWLSRKRRGERHAPQPFHSTTVNSHLDYMTGFSCYPTALDMLGKAWATGAFVILPSRMFRAFALPGVMAQNSSTPLLASSLA